ncbi:efflux RND transporter periplasmic adaptor subunit [Stutzerimonas stutzeri]|uniref:efflux RND transporter periplasmic adaptor subunit n=1 Tax=Stutzerimonas stutzeri TaxID=316 RepID=UPI003C6FA9C6
MELPGEITFNQDRTAQVGSSLRVVEAVKVDLGEQVKQGQVLAVIASTDLSERRSEFYAAQKTSCIGSKTYRRERSYGKSVFLRNRIIYRHNRLYGKQS